AKYTQTLVCVFNGNRHFGRHFLTLLSTHVPINVCSFMWIVHGLVEGFGKLIIGSFFGYELLIIFWIHLIFAFCIKVIHKPSKVLLHLMASNKSKRNNCLKSKLKLYNLIMAIHTKKQYGFRSEE